MAAFAAFGFVRLDQSTPEAAVRAFAAALQNGDLKAAARIVKGGKPDSDFSAFEKQFKSQKLVISIENFKADVQGDKATATYALGASVNGQAQPSTQDKVHLERIGEVWLIVPPTSGNTASPFESLAAMLCSPHQAMVQALAGAQKAACLSNVKQICLGILMLANDYDDVFHFKPDNWVKAIMPYVKNNNIFHCPNDKSGAVSYSVNPYLAGKNETKVAAPADTVLVYEGSKLKLNFRHGGSACVGFADGHVRMVTAQQAKALRWKP